MRRAYRVRIFTHELLSVWDAQLGSDETLFLYAPKLFGNRCWHCTRLPCTIADFVSCGNDFRNRLNTTVPFRLFRYTYTGFSCRIIFLRISNCVSTSNTQGLCTPETNYVCVYCVHGFGRGTRVRRDDEGQYLRVKTANAVSIGTHALRELTENNRILCYNSSVLHLPKKGPADTRLQNTFNASAGVTV